MSVFGFSGLFGRPGHALGRAGPVHRHPAEDLPGAVVRADGCTIRDLEFDLKFIAARHRIGDPIEFVFVKDGRESAVSEAPRSPLC